MTTQESNFTKMGRVTQWVLTQGLKPTEVMVYLYIARMNVGYGQYTTTFLSTEDIAKAINVGVATVRRTLPGLRDKNYIVKVSTNQVENIGKLPYKYQLNMQLDKFPSLGTLAKNKEENVVKKDVSKYFMDTNNRVQLLHDSRDKTTKEWKSFCLSGGELLHPTEEQLIKSKE